ncbi:hypothetical protein BJ170DRAFT_600496 [Xylariales sp. AK1849]|nr:hypothetical protein BJ170DRAFT_600496 [Xylariales sp. AK1849]
MTSGAGSSSSRISTAFQSKFVTVRRGQALAVDYDRVHLRVRVAQLDYAVDALAKDNVAHNHRDDRVDLLVTPTTEFVVFDVYRTICASPFVFRSNVSISLMFCCMSLRKFLSKYCVSRRPRPEVERDHAFGAVCRDGLALDIVHVHLRVVRRGLLRDSVRHVRQDRLHGVVHVYVRPGFGVVDPDLVTTAGATAYSREVIVRVDRFGGAFGKQLYLGFIIEVLLHAWVPGILSSYWKSLEKRSQFDSINCISRKTPPESFLKVDAPSRWKKQCKQRLEQASDLVGYFDANR